MSLSLSKTNCCVVGCSNYYAKGIIGLKFHVFPSEKRDPQRRQKWIVAVNRLGKDGKLWQPSSQSRICSAHFIGGEKSDDMNHPAYIPTIFPDIYKKRVVPEDRYIRLKKRREVTSEKVHDNEPVLPHIQEMPSFSSGGTQTDLCEASNFPGIPVLLCCITAEGVSCQTNTPTLAPLKPVKHKSLISTGAGENNVNVNPFSGYSNIHNDEQMSSICGVTTAVFGLLLGFLTEKSYKISKENMLLLFLMKMKLGISYSALTVFFGISRQTVARLFENVLQTLVIQTKEYVFWPSREVVNSSMPDIFKEYRNLGCIIGCSEFHCEKPCRVDEQVFLYSNYKGYYTFKYLLSITPSGFISFISEGFGGRSTDSFITTNSGFLKL